MSRNVKKLLVRAAALRDIITTELGSGAIGVKWTGLIDGIVEQAEDVQAEMALLEVKANAQRCVDSHLPTSNACASVFNAAEYELLDVEPWVLKARADAAGHGGFDSAEVGDACAAKQPTPPPRWYCAYNDRGEG